MTPEAHAETRRGLLMALELGTRLGHYEIVEPIGKGGMGEVYRARDTKLGRDVAIKVLPEEFSNDRERLDRFEREAQLLAQLNHPNIATLHGLEEHQGLQFLIMELVEGITLAEHLAKGPIRLDETYALFVQIAQGLEAAHEAGVIHRDLKPSNIGVKPDGTVKVLDFGLAKSLGPDSSSTSASGRSESPTRAKAATKHGVIVGTAAYMSPEQARGKPLDARTDVWSFGCVLYEALTDRAPFGGETIADTIAQVLDREPNWEKLPSATPLSVRTLLRRCLAKDPRKRLPHIGAAR